MCNSSIASACNPGIRACLVTLLLFDSAVFSAVGSLKYSCPNTLTTAIANLTMAKTCGFEYPEVLLPRIYRHAIGKHPPCNCALLVARESNVCNDILLIKMK